MYIDIWLTNAMDEMERINRLIPIKYQNDYILFWRPQKVGSSTILSILLSHGFRYNLPPRPKICGNAFCNKIMRCADFYLRENNSESAMIFKDAIKQYRYRAPCTNFNERGQLHYSVNHEICFLNADLIQDNLQCAFQYQNIGTMKQWELSKPNPPKTFNSFEILALRDPLERLISSYYFYGEHTLMMAETNPSLNLSLTYRLGDRQRTAQPIYLKRYNYLYHGDETTPPDTQIADKFVEVFPIFPSLLPGPSFTWSAFAANPSDATRIVASDRIMSIVIERLDESLVVLSYYMKWSLADVVVTLHRKTSSRHPKSKHWPETSIQNLRNKLIDSGEYDVYNAATNKLNERIQDLEKLGINLKNEIHRLNQLRNHSTELCLRSSYRDFYRRYIESHDVPKHPLRIKLRDADDKYTLGGHAFSFVGELLLSSDVCGSCEAHLMILVLDRKIKYEGDLDTLSIQNIDARLLQNNLDFTNCPVGFQ